MTSDQRIKLNMYLAVRNLKNLFAEAINSISKYGAAADLLQKSIDQIQQVSEQQGIDKSGITIDKNKLRAILIALTVKNSGKISILAISENNDTLLNEVRLTESDLTKLAEIKIRDKARVIYDKVQANLEKLREQGINEDTQKKFLEAINAFNNALSTPRTGIAERRLATQKLVNLFKAAENSIDIMDLAVQSARDEQPDFYNAYRAARKLVDPGNGKLALRAVVTDAISGEPLKKARFTFRLNGGMHAMNGNGAIVKETSEKGTIQLKKLDPGNYLVSVQKNGYKNKEVEVNIPGNERVDLKVGLEKI
jgi:hypothetical protein